MVHEIDPEKDAAMSTLKECPFPLKCSFEDALLGFRVFNVFPLLHSWSFQNSRVLLVLSSF